MCILNLVFSETAISNQRFDDHDPGEFFLGPTFDLEIYRTRVKGHLKHFNPKATQKVCGIAVPPAFIEKSFLVWFKASTASGYGTARGKKTLLCIRIHVNVL